MVTCLGREFTLQILHQKVSSIPMQVLPRVLDSCFFVMLLLENQDNCMEAIIRQMSFQLVITQLMELVEMYLILKVIRYMKEKLFLLKEKLFSLKLTRTLVCITMSSLFTMLTKFK